MAKEVPPELSALIDKMQSEYTDSEWKIATALAESEGPLSIEALATETGYTNRTIKKRVGTLEEKLEGKPLLSRTDAGEPKLHPELARAIRAVE